MNDTEKIRTLLDNEALTEAIAVLNDTKSVLMDVVNGKSSMIKACNARNLNYKHVRDVLKSKSFTAARDGISLNLERCTEFVPNGYQKLYSDVFKIYDASCAVLPPDYRETTEQVLHCLNGREEDILRMYYGIGQPAAAQIEIAEKYNITRERVRQIRVNTIHKLSQSGLRERLLYGDLKYNAMRQADEACTAAQEAAVKEWILEQIEETRQNTREALKDSWNSDVIRETLNNLDPDGMSIEKLGLTRRTYNCLKRSGVNTVQDMLACHRDDFLKMRNMGVKSADEAAAACDVLMHKILNRLEENHDDH